ncbi:MAG: polymer-forming cytoskeletal protein [Bradymonadaceae bacterium]
MSDTTIGDGLTVDGDITGGDSVTVDGEVRGSIDVHASVVVTEAGAIEADIEALDVRVEGQLHGHVRAEQRARLEDGSHVIGDIVARRIHIADGANFQGHIDMNIDE